MRAPISSSRRQGLRRLALAGVLASSAWLGTSSAALATFPGANGKIAFERGGAIWALNPDGTGLTQITKPPAGVFHSDPAWSPGGGRLAFTRNGEIYTVTATGGDLRRITDNPDIDSQPGWSPNGEEIVFQRQIPPDGPYVGDTKLYAASVNSPGSERRLTTGYFSGDPDWAPDNSLIAFTSTDEPVGAAPIQVVSPFDSTSARILGPTDQTRDYSFSPSWSPDSMSVAISSYDGLGVMKRDSPEVRELFPPGTNTQGVPSWSPDGSQIAFERGGQIWITDVDGSDARQLTTRGGFHPSWQSLRVNPLPRITAVQPTSVTAGGGATILSIFGADFIPGSKVRINGEDRATTFVSALRLNATLTQADRSLPGNAAVSVFTPGPGGGITTPLTLAVTGSTPPPVSAPVSTSLPTIAGRAAVGSPLACSVGSWTNAPTSFAWQWLRGGTPIGGADGASYIPGAADAGQATSCRITASNAGGFSTAVSLPVVPLSAEGGVPIPPSASVPSSPQPGLSGGLVPQPVPVTTPAGAKATTFLIRHAQRVAAGSFFSVRITFAKKVRSLPVLIEQRFARRWIPIGGRRITGPSGVLRVRLRTPGYTTLRVRVASPKRYSATFRVLVARERA